jgi:hypothetical protein
VEQHMQALELANSIRLARAELKRHIKAGDVLAAEVLLGDVPDFLEGMRLEEFCNAIPRYQWRFHQQLMQSTHTGLAAVIGDLTARKRRLIAEELGEWEAAADERRRARAHRHAARSDSVRRAAA